MGRENLDRRVFPRMTFFYSDGCEYQALEPVALEAACRGIEIRFSDRLDERAEIGVYCQHASKPNADFSIIMLHDLAQRHDVWPAFWQFEPWSAFDIGLLPGKAWVERWQTQVIYPSSHPRIGVFDLGWPKADLVFRDQGLFKEKAESLKAKLGLHHPKSVLYAPSWENHGKQDDFVRAFVNLPVNVLLKQAPWPTAYPDVLENINQMNQIHRGCSENVHIIDVDVSIMHCLGLADVIVSDESSVLTEALLLDVPGVAVTDWLIPDSTPPRFACVPYPYTIKTTKANLRQTVETILGDYEKVHQRTHLDRDHQFSHLGFSAACIMDTIEAAVSGQALPYPPVIPAMVGQTTESPRSEGYPASPGGEGEAPKSIQYSDGIEIEKRIDDLLQATVDLGSMVSIQKEHHENWAIRYHLCAERANLLRHLSLSGMDILEIGAGMGGVSRFLAEEARSLTIVEGTEARFSALRSRLRDLKNWQGHVCNFQDYVTTKKFDAIFCIGVLEYAELYTTVEANSSESPFTAFLKHAIGFLKEDGVLVLAIENQLGLKYWSGAAEDHLGMLFQGISGYPSTKSPKTFSRHELIEVLNRVGLSRIEEHYPFPDYKVPTSVITRDLMVQAPELAAGIAISDRFENYGTARIEYFPESLALHALAKADLLPEFSNSFLFLATRHSASAVMDQLLTANENQGELAWHYGVHRHLPVMTLFGQGPGGIQVSKKQMSTTKPVVDVIPFGEAKLSWHSLEPTPVLTGQSLRLQLVNHGYFMNWKDYFGELERFLAWSFQKWACPEGDPWLSGQALDAIPQNAIPDGAGYNLFDLEWSLDRPMLKSWFIYRIVIQLSKDYSIFDKSCPFDSLASIYHHLTAKFGIRRDLHADCLREARLQAVVLESVSISDAITKLDELVKRPFPQYSYARDPGTELYLRRAGEQLPLAVQTIKGQQAELAAIGRDGNPGPEGFLFVPDWQEPTWAEILVSYLQAFGSGEPVALIFPLFGSANASPSLEEAQALVLDVVDRMGGGAFPNIVIIEDPLEAVEVLKVYPTMQWIPSAPEEMNRMVGPNGRRFARSREQVVRDSGSSEG